jgi:signal transduction histidine kinase/DNA-binding response OmpR family regulator
MWTVELSVAILGLVGIAVLAGVVRRLRRRIDELERAAERAREVERSKSEFLANMSHEIRTPMTAVLGMVKLMQTQPLDGKLKRYVETIDASANALLTILNDILDFSKLEAAKFTIEAIPFQPHIVVREVAELLSSRAHDKGVELVYRTDPSMPSVAVGDPARLKQILMNLVGNAVKFTDQGEVFVDAGVASKSEAGFVLRVAVYDTGVGIEAADLPKIYEAFSQGAGSALRRQSGTGLGLAICKRLLAMMGGDISVESHVGEGSVFTFTVELAIDARAEARSWPAGLPGRRVLVAEPNRRWSDVIAEHLRAWGLDHELVREGTSIDEVVDRASREGKKFDFVVVGKSVDVEVRDIATGRVTRLHKPLRFSELYECLAGPADKPAKAAVEARAKATAAGTILVVDDNEVNQFVVVEELELRGYRVETVRNGVEALDRVKRGGLLAVLMDCQMPVMDGYAATKEIRRWESTSAAPRVPIIALTAHAMAGERERVLAAGMDAYISKPFRASSLEEVLAGQADGAEPPVAAAGARVPL